MAMGCVTVAVARTHQIGARTLALWLLKPGKRSEQQMAQTVAKIPRHHSSRISLRVWRFVPSGPQWLYTYSGTIDHAVLGTVMQTVRRLTAAIPGEWVVDVLVVGVEHGLLRAVEDDLHDLRRRGVHPLLRHAPRLRRWLPRRVTSVDATPPPLLH